MSNRKLIGQRLMEGRKSGRELHQQFKHKSNEKKRIADKEAAIGPKRKDDKLNDKKLFVEDHISDDEVNPLSGHD